MKVVEKIIEEPKKCDSRGRVTLGSEYSNKKVKLAIIDIEGEE